MSERQVQCEACRGSGEIEYGHPNAPDPDYVLPCQECNGDGWYIVDDGPLTLEDALELDRQKLRDLGIEP
jgi:DnaJ-class molecular chaperone